MNEPLSRDEIMGISTAVETSFNTFPVLSSSFTYFYCRNATLPNPDREKFDNTGFVGLQQEGATIQRSGFVSPPAIQFSGDVDTGIVAIFARRMLGKADSVSLVVAAESYAHQMQLLGNRTAAGRQLPSSSFIFTNGGLDYIYAGVVGSQMSVQQNGAEVPQYTVDFAGSGVYKKVSTIGSFGTPTPPADNTGTILDGAETELEYTTGAGTKFLAQINAAANQALKSVSATIVNNALDTADRRAGAKRLNSTDPTQGWVLSFLLHNDRSATAQFRSGVPAAGTTVDELVAALNDTLITNFKLRFQGAGFATFASTPASRNRFEVDYQKAYFRNVRRASDSGAEFLDVNVFPVSTGSTTDADFTIVNVTAAGATSVAIA